MNKHPEIFLSYSHKNKEVAESIDKDFQSIGITFLPPLLVPARPLAGSKKFAEAVRMN